MRTTLQLSVAAATLMALSCSSGEPTACEGSESIPQQSVDVGEDKRVMEFCFEDPGGGTLTYSATSADESVVEAFIRGTVFVRGVSPGQTTVTATAVNEADKSASVEFQVVVTNQAPQFTDSVTADAVGVGRFGFWDIHSLFVEPDGDEMTFEAASDFPGLTVFLTDSLVYFTGTSAGQAEVTLTATDPHGEKGSGTISVSVWTPAVVFDDEFDSDASLDDWEAASETTELAIVDGALVVSTTDPQFFGIAERSGEGVDEYYLDITTRISTGVTGTIWFASSEEVYRVLFGGDGNDSWQFHRWRGDGWVDAVGEGNSSLIALDRYRTYSILMYDRAMQLLADGQLVETVIFDDFTATTTIDLVWLVGVEDGTEYDRAQLRGRPGTSYHDTADRDAERALRDERMLKLPSLPEYH